MTMMSLKKVPSLCRYLLPVVRQYVPQYLPVVYSTIYRSPTPVRLSRSCSTLSTVKTVSAYEEDDNNSNTESNSNLPMSKSELQEEELARKTLANLTPDKQKELKVIKLQYDYYKAYGDVRVPPVVFESMWLKLLNCRSDYERQGLYAYYRKIIGGKIKKKHRHQEHLARVQQRLERGPLPAVNTIFMYVYDSSMVKHYNHRLAMSMRFGQPLVFDLAFDDILTERFAKKTAIQIMSAYACNKVDKEPFHLHFCNVNPDSTVLKTMEKSCPTDDIMATFTETSYLDLFPKENIVYLTPTARTVLHKFDHDAVYIIGGIVDPGTERPVTMAKAKRQNIKMAKFPLDAYVDWYQGSKSLCLNQVVQILCDVKANGDWLAAFEKSIPRRKVKNNHDD